MLNWLKKFALAYLIYLGISGLVILPAMNLLAPWFMSNSYERQLDTQIIYFNPFTLAIVARKARLDNPDGSNFIAFERAEINLSMAGIYKKGWVLDKVQLKSLDLSLARGASGEFNFQDLLATQDQEPPVAEDPGVPGITIQTLELSSRQIQLSDQQREIPFATHLDGLAIQVQDLSTVTEEGKPYTLSVRTENGGQLQWEGTISIPAASSEGKLTLTNISLVPAWRFIAPWVKFELIDGHLSTAGRYKVGWGDTITYAISDGSFSLNDLEALPSKEADLSNTRVALRALTIDGIDLDDSGSIEVASIQLTEPQVSGWSEGDRVSLADLLTVDGLPTTNAEAQPAPHDETPWTALVHTTDMTRGTISWGSEFTDPGTTVLSALQVKLGKLQWPLAGDTPLSGSVVINETSEVSINGELDLDTGNGAIELALEQLSLAWFQPAIPPEFKAELNSGSLNATSKIVLRGFSPSQLTMDGGINDLSVTVRGEEKTLSGWKALYLKGLAVDFNEQYVSLETLRLTEFNGRIHIYADGSINTQNVLAQKMEEADIEVDVAAEAAKDWGFDISSIQVTDSEVDFMDESLPIQFRTQIGHLDGEVTGLSSDPERLTNIDFKGTVDNYAPVVLAGSARPLADPPALDLGLSFEGLDLARLTPYSGAYAGYAINRGVMTLKVHYSLEDDRLKGDNNLIIDQLQLGDKIQSEQAADLPLELAVALLTDASGVIDLAVPVSGNINDPAFSLGGVIAGAFVNLVLKAATAPFTLLASLVGSEEDLQRINFPTGETAPDDQAKQKMQTLVEALQQRPALTVLIDGRINPDMDRERLQKNALAAQFIAQGISAEEVKTKGPNWAQLIEKRYRDLGLPETDESAQPLSVRRQYEAVAANITLPDDALKTLAEERAVETKRYFVTELGLAADRAAIDTVDLNEENHSFSGVELNLDD